MSLDTDRDGNVRRHNTVMRMKVPMCENHNRYLDQHFEHAAKPLVREIFEDGGNLVLSPDDAAIVGLWWVKTWLLLAHPDARSSREQFHESPWEPTPTDLYHWMVHDKAPPVGLSLWLTKHPADERDEPTAFESLPPDSHR